MKHIIDKITHPTPHLEPPTLPKKLLKAGSTAQMSEKDKILFAHRNISRISMSRKTDNDTVSAARKQYQLISSDLMELIGKADKSNDHPEKKETEVWEEITHDEFQENASNELAYDDDGITIMAINATDDPILQAHTEISLFKRRKRDHAVKKSTYFVTSHLYD